MGFTINSPTRSLCRCLVALAAVLLAANTGAGDLAPTSADYVVAFKNFLQSPPVIKSLKAVVHSTRPTGFLATPDGPVPVKFETKNTFVEIRYQSNALFVKSATDY